MAASTHFLDLPVELIVSILSYFEVPSFLNLTSTCKALHQAEYIYDHAYWSGLTRTTFRVPNCLVIEKDGERWQKLFKRMLTQSRVYTWGNNEKGCLGHSYDAPGALASGGLHGVRRAGALRKRHISWPEKMQRVEDLGAISDLQCGGWSTTLLTAKGALYTVGVLDGLEFDHRRPQCVQKVMVEPMPLRFPPGFAHPYDRYDSSTAVRQFSAGRAHVLALSDSGRIWSWQNIEHAALHVRFIHHETVENGKTSGMGVVKKVVAGWSKSAALVEGAGIVLWDPLCRRHDDNELEDAALVLESVAVPKTAITASNGSANGQNQSTSSSPALVGQVCNFVVLEEVVIFNTHLGKVFVAQIFWNDQEQRAADPIELQLPASQSEDDTFVTDVQGSFQSFGVFTRSGLVLTSNQDRLMELLQGQLQDRPLWTRIPALQHRKVIQLAFGDYHFHALHSPGYITSYGTEPQMCGALGLGGGRGGGEGRLRGIRYTTAGAGGDGRLIQHAYSEGRRVWFQRDKRAWMHFLASGGADAAEGMERVRQAIGSPGIQCHGEVSEWIEQEGRDWETKFGIKCEDDDGFGCYFAMSVSAAGWHSAALVLENNELVEKLKRACEVPDPTPPTPQVDPEATTDDPTSASLTSWLFDLTIATGADWTRWVLAMPPYDALTAMRALTSTNGSTNQMDQFKRMNYDASPRVGVSYTWANDHFPRLKLSDGTEMPGLVPFDDWRYGRPEWDLDFSL